MPNFICIQCHINSYSPNSKRKFCSRKCFAEFLKVSRLGKNNPNWAGKDVSYGALHDYIKWHMPKPDLCSQCKVKGPIDLANISGKYRRDFKDWEWLCRRCHMKKDGRIEQIVAFNRSQGFVNLRKGGRHDCKVR